MNQIYTFRWAEYNKYGDEYYRHDFISAASKEEARQWVLELNPGDASHHCEHCGASSPIGLEIYDATDGTFWDTFLEEEDLWLDALLEWAAEDREMAAALWKMAIENDCDEVLALDALRALVEQYEIDLVTEGKEATPGAKKCKSL